MLRRLLNPTPMAVAGAGMEGGEEEDREEMIGDQAAVERGQTNGPRQVPVFARTARLPNTQAAGSARSSIIRKTGTTCCINVRHGP